MREIGGLEGNVAFSRAAWSPLHRLVLPLCEDIQCGHCSNGPCHQMNHKPLCFHTINFLPAREMVREGCPQKPPHADQ
jgi:hypothetical protein